MAFDSANLVLSGTAWSVDQPQNGGDRYLSVSMSESWTDKQSGQRKYGQPQHYRVYPTRFAQGLQAVLDQIGQLRNQGLMVDVTVVGTIGSVNAYVSQKDNTPKASVTVNAIAIAITGTRQKGGAQQQGYGQQPGYTQQSQGGFQQSQPPTSDPWSSDPSF